MSTLLAGLSIYSAALFSLPAANKYPPAPDFSRRVDYVAWVRQLIKVPAKENAYEAYASFMPGLVDGDADADDWPRFTGMLTERRVEGTPPQYESGNEGRRWPGPMPWHPSRRTTWESSFKRTRSVLSAFTKAAQRNRLDTAIPLNGAQDDKPNRLVFLPMPHLAPIRQCAEATLENAWRIRKDDVSANALIKAFDTNLRVAGQMRESPFTVEHLVACAIRNMTYDHIRWAFAHRVLTEKHAKRLIDMLEEVDDEPLAASPALQGECAAWLDSLQYVFGPLGGGTKFNGNRYQEVTGQSMGATNRFGLGARLESDPQGSAAAILEAHRNMEQHMQPGFGTDHYAAIVTLADRMREASQVNKGLMLGEGSNYPGLYGQIAKAETQRRGVQTLARIFAYKATHKKWPEKLSALGKSAKKDCIDACSGEPLIYAIVAKDPVLYSVGLDGDDDGGIHDPNWSDNDFVLWPILDSEEAVRTARLNRLPEKKLTSLAKIDKSLTGKKITIAGEVTAVTSQPSEKLGIRYSVMLEQGKDKIELYYPESVHNEFTPRQNITEGKRIRAIVQVEEYEGRPVLHLEKARNLAIEE